MEEHRMTWLAIIAAFVLLFPGLLLGGIAAWIYFNFLFPSLDGNLFNWITAGWFKTITMAIFPNVLHGGIGGAVAMYVTSRLLKFSNYEIVAYSVSTIVVLVGAFGLFAGFMNSRLGLGHVELVSQVVGMLGGLFFAAQHAKEEQRARMAKPTEPANSEGMTA